MLSKKSCIFEVATKKDKKFNNKSLDSVCTQNEKMGTSLENKTFKMSGRLKAKIK